jgi:predicted nucleotidyltransferase
MSITKILYNGRERDRRGHNPNFDDLPIDVKDNFRKIKQSIENYFDKEMDIRVVGSYLEGYYDEFSDYNVAIDEDVNITEFSRIISNECQVDVKVVFDTIKYSKSIIK